MSREIDRREFTREALLALLSGVTVTLSACGGGYGGSSMSPAAPTDGGAGATSSNVVGVISANHGHQAIVTGAELLAGDAVRLNIQGQADHNHVVDLTAADIQSIRSGNTVRRVSSSTEAHDHDVTFARSNDPNQGPGY
jgi:hypothetical protein